MAELIMSLATAKLPSDPAELRAFAASLQVQLQTREAELYAKTLHIEKLKAQLALLKRARYGRSSEKLDGEIEQLELLIGDLEEGGAESAGRSQAAQPSAPAMRRERSLPVRRPLPAHLPRDRVDDETACACPSCGGTVLTTIGTDEREVYAFTEHGVAMLSSVLRSTRAVQMNILIIRAFVQIRELLASNKDLAARVEKLEAGQQEHASIIGVLAEEIDQMKLLPEPPKRPIGFRDRSQDDK